MVSGVLLSGELAAHLSYHRLVQEYCDCGTLGNVANQLRESGAADSMLKLVRLLLDVANGLKVLHSRNTVHGDLVSFLDSHVWV